MLKSYALLKVRHVSTAIGIHSSLLVVNLISDDCRPTEENALEVNAMNVLIQELQMCYTQTDYHHSWKIDELIKKSKETLSMKIMMWKPWEDHTEYWWHARE